MHHRKSERAQTNSALSRLVVLEEMELLACWIKSLNGFDALLIHAVFYVGVPQTVIADSMGVSPSWVCRHLDALLKDAARFIEYGHCN